jgi:hypothetical protein
LTILGTSQRAPDRIIVTNPQKYQNVGLHQIIALSQLTEKKICSLYAGGEANFPEEYPIESYVMVEDVLKKQKDLKKIQSLNLESKIQEGREDSWEKKSESKMSELPEGSKVVYIIDARHVGIKENVMSKSSHTENSSVPESGVADWGLKGGEPIYLGDFYRKLYKFGHVTVIDLTQEAIERCLKNKWKLG